jgi:hypothetical protein
MLFAFGLRIISISIDRGAAELPQSETQDEDVNDPDLVAKTVHRRSMPLS